MTLNDYQDYAEKFAFYPKELGVFYTILGITGEAGELANKIKKVIRDKQGNFDIEDYENIKHEMGDILWYLAMTAKSIGITLDDVAVDNIEKLNLRKQNNTLSGSGDNR